MDLRVLQYFLAIAEAQSITKAAQNLHLSQPSLSKQMMHLEQELGVQLIERGKRRTTLTEDGRLLRKRAEDILSLVDKTEQDLSNRNRELAGVISIGGGIPPSLLRQLSAFKKEHPKISYDFYSADALDIKEKLDHGNLDFAIFIEPMSQIHYEHLHLSEQSRWGVLLPSHHPLAKKTKITKEDLLQLPLIIHRRYGLQKQLADWAGIHLDQLHISATYNILNGSPSYLIQEELGCLLMSEDQIENTLKSDIVFRPLYPELSFGYYLVWKKNNTFGKSAEILLNQLKGA